MKRILTGTLAVAAIAGGVILSTVTTEAYTYNGNIGSIIRASSSTSGEVNDNVGSIIKSSGNTSVTASRNVGSIVKTDGSAGDVTGNVGSIIKIDGQGRDVNEVLKEVDISKNVGSIVLISNVCGSADGNLDASKNVGSIVKIENSNSCSATTTSEVTVKYAAPVASTAPVANENPKATAPLETLETPAELPTTGINLSGIVIAASGVLAAGITYLIRRGN